ncbi:DinB family protein [Paenibacillus sp. SYP-B3998]|uniref:DinB family protein n=1 Tax=Paenibacillus sp. SYP-B3998 TaxID=2678564 RepID=A0A6G3ZX53_9BACL|nr:DinB family protein [Paenibacillus sp. SYP-B3998]NEW06284.1 DinB family protein [Paenibacillus sp. SYP-B3998]
MLQRPDSQEYASYYSTYTDLVPEGDYTSFLRNQLHVITTLYEQLSEERSEGRYAPGKWSLKEVLGHITDTERVMSYRMLRILRGDSTNLPGFDQDVFMANASFQHVSLLTLLDDFKAVRSATFSLLTTLTEETDWLRTGRVNDIAISARSLAYIIAGHAEHHIGVIQNKYL